MMILQYGLDDSVVRVSFLAVAIIAVPALAGAHGSVTYLWAAQQHRKLDEEGIRKLIDDSTTAWNAGNAVVLEQ